MKDTLKCEYCGAENRKTPIIQKPVRFGFKGEITVLPQINPDGRSQDNVCLPCFEFEVGELKN